MKIAPFTASNLTSYTRINLTDVEVVQGQILTFNQLAVLQNLRATIAEELLNLKFDAQNPVEFAQQNAYLRGQLDILTLQLVNSEEMQKQHIIVDSQPQS